MHNQRTGLAATLGGGVKKHDGSWLALLAFFSVITLGLSLIFAAVFASVTVALAGDEPPQIPDNPQVDPAVPGQTFSGIITDARCGSRHTDSEKSASECARMCVRNGSRYVIANGENHYQLAGNPEQFAPLAGQRVRLTGVLSGNTINASSASPQRAEGQN
jgi:hypothetical protein